MNEIKPTEEQIYEAVKFIRHWDRKTPVFRDGYWFKLISNTQVEVFNEEENAFVVFDLPLPHHSRSS